jgi:hypothetical protein
MADIKISPLAQAVTVVALGAAAAAAVAAQLPELKRYWKIRSME